MMKNKYFQRQNQNHKQRQKPRHYATRHHTLPLPAIAKRVVSLLLVLLIVGAALPEDVYTFAGELLSSLSATLSALAAEDDDYTAPDCEFLDELYDGSDAISALPSYDEYVEDYDYSEPGNISFTEFREMFPSGLTFSSSAAQSYNSSHAIMICDAQELYDYSQLVNNKVSGVDTDEISFYLSANIVLGNNIEYTDVSMDGYYFLPIGSTGSPFTGTFDGQGYEIRDLYTEQSPTKVALFGSVGEGGTVKNLGLYHPTIYVVYTEASESAGIAVYNYGTITDVYVIAGEKANDTATNFIASGGATATAGIVAYNYSTGTLSNSYFAGALTAESPDAQNPVCAYNEGTISNCYYDSEVFAELSSEPDTSVTEPDNADITALSNADIRDVTSDGGMKNTQFKNLRVNANGYMYPRLYGYEGTGSQSDPYIISTPAQLINFPYSYEYTTSSYFQLGNCIDMNEAAPYAYTPNMDLDLLAVDGTGTATTNTTKNIRFCGKLYGTATSDDSCSIQHVDSLGEDSEGNTLNGCHAILNLTIDTPASSTNNTYTSNLRFAALIAQSGAGAEIHDIQFIGGDISTGDTDCYQTVSTYDTTTRIATVVASTTTNTSALNVNGYTLPAGNNIVMDNVHSSANVHLGTGTVRNAAVGGLVGAGYSILTDCTNSGTISGGYTSTGTGTATTSYIYIGGIIGYSFTANSTTNANYLVRLTHVANYGYIYGAAAVAAEDADVYLSTIQMYASGIGSGYLSSGYTGAFTTNITDLTGTTVTDDNRMDRVANFAAIFDVPVETDEYGDPVYDSDGKPTAILPDDGYVILNSTVLSNNNRTYLYGIGGDRISNAYNGANLYSVAVERCTICGIGDMSTAAASVDDYGYQYYNFNDMNTGSIYMYVGGTQACGVARLYAYKCYNSGNISLLDGAICTRDYHDSNAPVGTGAFTGISGSSAYGCYNDGDIYIAPTERVTTLGRFTLYIGGQILVGGISGLYSSAILPGSNDVGQSINNGSLTVDLETNHFTPNYFTSSNNSIYPKFFIQGTGSGTYNENYGDVLFTDTDVSNGINVQVYVAMCGNAGYYRLNFNNAQNSSYSNLLTVSIEHCVNYADCILNGTSAAIRYTGIASAYVSTVSYSDNINFGDLTIDGSFGAGYWQYGCSVNLIGVGSINAKRNLYLGNFTMTEGTTVSSNFSVCDYYIDNSDGYDAYAQYIMNGWYSGCDIPAGFGDEYDDVFASLDPSKTYGNIYITGKVTGAFTYAMVYMANTTQYIELANDFYNNGSITISDFQHGNDGNQTSATIYGVSNGTCTNCKNYADITASNILKYGGNSTNYGFNIYGCTSGKQNINYGDITLTNYVDICAGSTGNIFRVRGMGALTSQDCENYGTLTATDQTTATVGGVEYTSPDLNGYVDVVSGNKRYDGWTQVNGIGGAAVECVNYGDIYLTNARRHYVSGISNDASVDTCTNYGAITVTNCDQFGYVGGISGYTASTVTRCLNFAEITITGGTSYFTNGNNETDKYIGGVVGDLYGGNVYSSANYGNIYYENTGGINSTSSKDNTRSPRANGDFFFIGGVIGYAINATVYSVLNYANVTVAQEDNVAVRCGGIMGQLATGSYAYNLVNYGDITIPYCTGQSKNTMWYASMFCGGIIGVATSSPALYGINYGTTTLTGESATNSYCGSIAAGVADYSCDIDGFVDLSTPADGVDDYKLIGVFYSSSKANSSSAINYTVSTSVQSNTGSQAGTIEVITLDDDENTGFYSPNFRFRSDLIHEITEGETHSENCMVYQDYAQLSDYLQAYMTSYMGSDYIKQFFAADDSVEDYGGYVVLIYDAEDGRAVDEYIPGNPSTKEDGVANYIGCTANHDDASVIKDYSANSIYLDMVGGAEYRTLNSDYDIYAQQIQDSSLPEILDAEFITEYQYTNTETIAYQYFANYLEAIETHAAVYNDGTVSDYITYTDINVYMAIDDLDITKWYDVGNDVKYEDENNNVIPIILSDKTLSQFSSMVFYTGREMSTTTRDGDTINYPDDMWLTADNVEDELTDDSIWYSDGTWQGNTWVINVPYDEDTYSTSVYTKVLGVITAEDGYHINIVVVHVMLDLFDPYAELDSVTLYTPVDGTVTSYVSDDEDEGIVVDPDMQDSITDNKKDENGDDSGEPAQDVIYYYMSDDCTSGENIQKWSTNSGSPTITITTHNMDEDMYLEAQVTYQDRAPTESEDTYNNMEWNYDAAIKNPTDPAVSSTYKIKDLHPENVTYDASKKSTGTVTITLDSSTVVYYGGMYRIDLYYERTKNSESMKHFATIYICKERSPENSMGTSLYTTTNPTTVKGSSSYYYSYTSQDTYDSDEDNNSPDTDGLYGGEASSTLTTYGTSAYSLSYSTNTTSGPYLSYKSQMGAYYGVAADSDTDDVDALYTELNTVTIAADNADGGTTTTLESSLDTITVNDTDVEVESGISVPSYYGSVYTAHTDVIAENGDVRRYTITKSYSAQPSITISSITRTDGVALDNGVATMYGDDTEDVTFTCTWTSSNVNSTTLTNAISASRVYVYLKATDSDEYVLLTAKEVAEYMTITATANTNTFTVTLNNSAAFGEYKILPYIEYAMDLSKYNTEDIMLMSASTGEEIEDGENNTSFTWNIPYSEAFTVVNEPNDDSYLMQYDADNDQTTPSVEEETTLDGDRSAYILSADATQTIHYSGYDDVRYSDATERVEYFTIYSFVGKTTTETTLRLAAPYRATITQYTGTVPADTDEDEYFPDFDSTYWESMESSETESSTDDYKEYSVTVNYNEDNANDNYTSSITYYKVTAEDGKTETIYKVYVIPGVRNKTTTLEIAQSDEISNFGKNATDENKAVWTELFNTSDALYQEIVEKYGYVSATIKEIGVSGTEAEVTAYQTKFFDGTTEGVDTGETESYIYNLKSYVYVIDIDLPVGYSYDVYVFSSEMDSAYVLSDSEYSYDGKQLVITSTSEQALNLRIVLKRDSSYELWGVQYIWNYSNTAVDDDNHVAVGKDNGLYNNYVYNTKE